MNNIKDTELENIGINLSIAVDYPGLYILKALCALFVVIYHVPLYLAREIIPITGTAVPCFYMISGYFLFCGDEKKELQRAYSWLKKILIITFLINLFYFFIYFDHVVNILYNYPRLVLPLFFQGGVIAPHLWYLCALWEALIVFIFVRKYFSQKILYIAPLLILVSLCSSRYSFLFGEHKHYGWVFQSFLAPALPCLSIGYMVRKHITYFVRNGIWWILMVIFLLLIYTERWLLITYENVPDDGSYYLFTLPLAMSFFLITLKMSNSASIVVSIGKYHSSNIYYFHMFVAGCISPFFVYIMGKKYYSITALVVYVASIFLSITIRWAYKKLKLLQRNA